ncbi:hypothetical protein CMI47_06685 [Candidatus Pacearchaeota archaeon]|nr:hypothetical protein [Candidatus Pacearchaeota archaeon]|tara:strand:- start:9568 stop:10047 length:480 start_codon:yes stop_codon:yes gene_type:complete
MAISFKSVGSKSTLRKFHNVPDSKPVGIRSPLRLGEGRSGLFEMHFSLADQLHDNLKNLILTNHGERLGSFDFGANLRELTTELVSQKDFDTEAMLRINNAVNKFLPFVELETYESKFGTTVEKFGSEPGLGKIVINISYNIPRLRIVKKQISAILYAI